MKEAKTILVTGASGLVGSSLCRALVERGDSVRRLSRSGGEFGWDLEKGVIDESAFEGVDTIVHLAGEPIAQRWTQKVKSRILSSRVDSTRLLVKRIAELRGAPPSLICASGSNFYGYECGGGVDESAMPGNGFLAEVCREWEDSAVAAIESGARVTLVRTGVVLSLEGGALSKMLPPFRVGAGGRVGSGKQLMSWISLPDLVSVYLFCIDREDVSGPLNAVAPGVVDNQEFTDLLGRILKRPTLFPVPEFVVKVLFGEMGTETILADVGLEPKRLMDLGFVWKHSEMVTALQNCLIDGRN